MGQVRLRRAAAAQNARVHKSRTCAFLPMEEQPQRRLPKQNQTKVYSATSRSFLTLAVCIKRQDGTRRSRWTVLFNSTFGACAQFVHGCACRHLSIFYRCMVHLSSASSSSGLGARASRAWLYVNHCLDRLCISGHCVSCFSTTASKKWYEAFGAVVVS